MSMGLNKKEMASYGIGAGWKRHGIHVLCKLYFILLSGYSWG